MYLMIICLPLLSFIVNLFFGRFIGKKGSILISNILIFLSMIFAFFIFNQIVIMGNIKVLHLFSWFNIGILNQNFSFYFDTITSSMLILVLIVSFLVHFYSTSYMLEDPHLIRFMAYLSLFTFFMLVLITSQNIIQLFIGWEGVGLCSYLLINFWYTRIKANKSSIKAMIINKIGDIGLLLGMILIWIYFGSFDYFLIFINLTYFNDYYISTINLLLLIGVIGKSAQLGLHMWLPDAMEGPTPVSALIHAATMVTAGVFLIIRLSPLFEYTPIILILIILIGSFTAFFSSTISLCQNDLKKVIAYSTCSQLGYMVMICGFSYYYLGLFHLVNHGFFKALLFLGAGSIIHSLNDEQDMRKMGGLKFLLPFSYISLLIGSISLMGLPFLTGFYSKDLIIENLSGSYFKQFAFWLGLWSAFFTSAYSLRLIFWTFYDNPKINIKSWKYIHESSFTIILSLFSLLILSIIGGYFLQYQILKDYIPIIITDYIKLLPLIVTSIAALVSLMLGYKSVKIIKYHSYSIFIRIYSLFNSAWYFDSLINYYFIPKIFRFGFNISYKLIDNNILEFFGPTKSNELLISITNKISKIHTGKLSFYSFILLLFIFCFLIKF